MKELIMSKSLPFGDTPSGRDWCIKALHPADPLTTLDGIPDEDSYPVVMQNYAQSFNVPNPLAGSNIGNWDVDVFFYPHPYLLGAVRVTDATAAVTWYPLLNNQITGATAQDKQSTLRATVERYRLAYMGITGYLNAPATSNSGLCAAAQYMQTPAYSSVMWGAAATVTKGKERCGADPDAPTPVGFVRQAEHWMDAPRTFEQLQNMPNSYTGAAREGVYVPYRLSETHQDWVSASDVVVSPSQETSNTELDGSPYGTIGAGTSALSGPYGLAGLRATSWGSLIHRRADSGMAHISFKQLNPTASLMFYFRGGWEYQVLPGTSMCAFQKSSPPYDPRAIQTYFQISRELKDAYPSDYNDLGKILGTIWEVAKTALGTVFPVARIPLALASMAGKFLMGSQGSSPTNGGVGSKEPVPDLTSAATRERVQKAVSVSKMRVGGRAIAARRKPVLRRKK
jgi:hypothetical protein